MIRYLPIDIAIEGVGCHAGKGGGGRFKKKERKERTSEVTVRPEIIYLAFALLIHNKQTGPFASSHTTPFSLYHTDTHI